MLKVIIIRLAGLFDALESNKTSELAVVGRSLLVAEDKIGRSSGHSLCDLDELANWVDRVETCLANLFELLVIASGQIAAVYLALIRRGPFYA